MPMTHIISGFNRDSVPLIRAALTHLQYAHNQRQELSHLKDLIDPESLDTAAIAQLCEDIADKEGPEGYMVLAISTAHITSEDTFALRAKTREPYNMVLERTTGYFIKLFDDWEMMDGEELKGFSEELKEILKWAHAAGYRMVELDRDAEIIDQFPTFDW